MENIHILIVEDERQIAEILQDYMHNEGFEASIITNGRDVIPFVMKTPPSLILLDLMLPGMDGETICREVRKISNLPIIMITAKVQEIDRIIGLELGADDYVCKPFSPREVVARVKSVLRRTLGLINCLTPPVPSETSETQSQGVAVKALSEKVLSGASADASNTIYAGPFELNLDSRELLINKETTLSLTPTEFEILAMMLKRPGRVFTRGQLIENVQGYDFEGYERTIDFHIKNLRKKIAHHLPNQKIIQAAYGVGYKLVV